MPDALLRFRDDDPRVRRLNDKPIRGGASGGEFVLYFMQAFRRMSDNAALDWAVERANELRSPCLVYEALRPDYPHASDRIHRFVLQGARDNASRAKERGLAHIFFLPRTPAQARGVVAQLTARAALVVSDDFPSFVVPPQNKAAALRADCAYFVVDDCAVVPAAVLAKEEVRTIRPKVLRGLKDWLLPLDEPAPRIAAPFSLDLPFEPVRLEGANVDALVSSCAIDHGVPGVEACGGSVAGEGRLDAFVRGALATYDTDRNDPSRDAVSQLSPYLHFGMVSARKVALEARSWGHGPAIDAFLEQLLVRRALSFTFARTRPDHALYSALPGWARKTLSAHASDRRYADLTVADLEAARSPDELWNAAMRELCARGTIQPYARMLWGKLPLLWMREPAAAHAAMVHLNDKWALDGRDPNAYANVSWCFGLHDRPWPERPVFGSVRAMTSASARRKLDFEEYVTRWG
jgi:deoxyribodipyrimidine photo-lyase